MSKQPNMKIGIGADTSDFEKGAKTVKQGLNDLSKTGTQALSSLGDAFGVNTGKVGQMTSAIRGLGQKMSECGNTGVAAFGNVLKAIGPLGGAIAGIGISAAVAGFKELKKEADAFKNTVAGANYEMATAAYVDTYKQILRDFNGDTGKAIAETESRWKKFWGTIGITVRELFTTGAWQGSYQNPAGGAAMEEYLKRINAAQQGGQKAQELSNQIYQLERQRKEQAVELAKLNDDIAEKMQVAKDASLSTAERQDAIYKVELMLSQKKAMTVGLEEKLAVLYREMSSLASDSVEAADATLAQSAREYEARRSITQEETALLRIKNSIGKASDDEIKRMQTLIRQQKELEENIKKVHDKWAGLSSVGPITGPSVSTPGVTAPTLSILPSTQEFDNFKVVLSEHLAGITIGVGIEPDYEQIQDVSKEVQNLMESSIVRSAEIMGNLIGTLAAGGDAWGEFKTAALSALGDMAIAVGKIAIQSGVAMLGIQAALKMDNPYVAIAAGAALVALGAAVKSSLSAIASGDYSASGGGYSSSASSGSAGSNYESREVKVYVTGTLEADGDKLIAVINNTNRSNYYKK